MHSIDFIRKTIRYDKDTGEFWWVERTPDMFEDSDHPRYNKYSRCKSWNKRYAGKKLNKKPTTEGYLVTTILGQHYPLHRLAIALSYNKFPEHQVDHINGKRDDNRLCNLRCVTKTENARNQKKHATNKSGFTGVRFAKHINKYVAYIGHSGKMHHLGCFEKVDDAIAARKAEEQRLGFHALHGRK